MSYEYEWSFGNDSEKKKYETMSTYKDAVIEIAQQNINPWHETVMVKIEIKAKHDFSPKTYWVEIKKAVVYVATDVTEKPKGLRVIK